MSVPLPELSAFRIGPSYKHRESDAEFKEAWDKAIDEAMDALEDAASRRAHDGVTKHVVGMGKVVFAQEEQPDDTTKGRPAEGTAI